MRIRGAVLCVVVVCAVLAGASTVGAGTTPFTIDAFNASRSPGDSIVVTGSGCPPTSPLVTGPALQLRLTPPTGGNAWGASLENGKVLLVSTQIGIMGEVDVSVVPEPDGTFSATFTVPANAPAGTYIVRGACTTLLEAGSGPGGFTQESYDAAFTETGTLQVLAVLVEAPPTFTG